MAAAATVPRSVSADYGSTPAFQLPWPDGSARNVSGFTYGSAGQICDGIPTDHTQLEKYAIDFGLVNEEVDAAARGQVGVVGNDPVGGNYVWIEHPSQADNLYETYYGHLSSTIYVRPGDYVNKNQRIAISDTSGSGASGAHLHFRVSKGGNAPFTGTGYRPEPMSGTGPPGYVGWQNYGCNLDTTTTFESTSPDQMAAVAAYPNPSSQHAEDLLVRGSTGDAWFTPADATGTPVPNGWVDAGGIVTDVLPVISDQPVGTWDKAGDRLDLFAVGPNSQIYHRAYVGGTFTGDWTSLGTTVVSASSETEALTVTRSPADDTIDLFFRAGGSQCSDVSRCAGYHVHTSATGVPTTWESIGGYVKGTPSARWDNSGTVELEAFVIGLDDLIYEKVYWPGYGWTTNWNPLNIEKASAQAENETISVLRRSDGTLDLLIRGQDRHGWQAHTDSAGTVWSWSDLGGVLRGAPDGKWNVPGPDSRIDVFAIGYDDQMYRNTYVMGGSWSGWIPLGGVSG